MVGKPQWQAVPARAARGNSWACEHRESHPVSPSAAQASSSSDPGGYITWRATLHPGSCAACLSDPLPEIRLQERLGIHNQEGQWRSRCLHSTFPGDKGRPSESASSSHLPRLHGEVKNIAGKYYVGIEHLDPLLSLSGHHSNPSHSISTKLGVRSHPELL